MVSLKGMDLIKYTLKKKPAFASQYIYNVRENCIWDTVIYKIQKSAFRKRVTSRVGRRREIETDTVHPG